MAGKTPVRVLVTGAAGQIGYSIVYMIASGKVFGDDQPVTLVLLDIPPMKDVLEGVYMELMDCALPTLHEVVPLSDETAAFKDIDYAFLVGSMPRKEGMERKDLLHANVKIFKSQGKALNDHAKPNCKVLVVGNPANTNAFICAKYAQPNIKPQNISAMTRLDHNRAVAQVAAKCGVRCQDVKNVTIWGNHSSTQFPDVKHAKVTKGGSVQDGDKAVNDESWAHNDFVTAIQKRGAAVIAKRKLSSAMSAAKAACDHMRDWVQGTNQDSWVSMAVISDGSYEIPAGIVYSFPVVISNGQWTIVKGLEIDEFARGKMNETLKELQEESEEALQACM